MPTENHAADHDQGHAHAHGHWGGHGRGHVHSHGHGHGHSHGHGLNRSRVFLALCLTGGFMVVEVIGGVLSGSLALLADAAHMLIDTLALFLTWLAFGLSARPADHERTYGYHRFPILAAFANGVGMVFVVGWICVEAIQRMNEPVEILATPMLVVAVVGLMVNIAAAAILFGADRDNLNVRGAFLHVMGDLLGSVSAIAAAVVIMMTGWVMIDPLLSFLVAALILRSTWFLIRDSGHILLEGTPVELDVREIGADLVENIDAVEDVHHVHAWSLAQDRSLLTLHARIREGVDPDDAIDTIHRRLAERFDVTHVTVQIEVEACVDHAPVAPVGTRAVVERTGPVTGT